jgi:methylated-DNA-[protein]-cysteine S-methyltransferase
MQRSIKHYSHLNVFCASQFKWRFMYTKKFKHKSLELSLYASDIGITKIDIIKIKQENPNYLLLKLSEELERYLDGDKFCFDFDLDILASKFQSLVWNELKKIPMGEVRTYKDIAIKVGGSNYSRAVGMANNKNPVPIIVPCHRVIGSNNKLTGYALGLDLKERLLKIEGVF